MKGKISEMMNYLDPKHLVNIDLSEQEIDELTAKLDFARIEQVTELKFNEIKDVGEAETSSKTSVTIKKRRNLKYLFVAVVFALCLATTAFASQMGYFDLMFGRGSNVPEDQIIKVAESIEKDGIVMTLEEILAGSGGGILIITFERKDGQPFPNPTMLADFDLVLLNEDGTEEDGRFSSQGAGYIQTEDNRKVTCYYSVSGGESLIGRQVKVKVGTLYVHEDRKLSMDLTLADYFRQNPDNIMTEAEAAEVKEQVLANMEKNEDAEANQSAVTVEDYLIEGALKDLIGDGNWIKRRLQDISKNRRQPLLPMEEERPDLTLNGMLLIDNVLFTGIGSESGKKHDNFRLNSSAGIDILFDTRTGEEISFSAGINDIYTFTDIKTADLPYLVPVVSYSLRDIVSEAGWAFTCLVEDRQQVRNIILNADITVEEGTYRIREASISPVEIRFIGYWPNPEQDRGVPDPIDVSLVLNDGLEVKMTSMGGFYRDGEFELTYMLTEDNQIGRVRRFLDRSITENLDKLLVDGHVYDLSK